MKREFLFAILLCAPCIMMPVLPSVAEEATPTTSLSGNTIEEARASLKDAYTEAKQEHPEVSEEAITNNDKKLEGAITESMEEEDFEFEDEDKEQILADKKQKYEDAKKKEQSLANRTLTAASIAATGIGGMELARGLSEQKADKDAANDMAAYIATMRCTYAEGKQVKAGPEEIELPGGNDQTLMNLRNEYFALAKDLKERKNALGLKPGIESEEILDKSATGLYDDESLAIDKSAYASLYRAQMLGSEEDQKKIDEEQSASKKRVLGGAIAAGAGVVVGVVGNSLINGKLGEKIKALKDKKESTKENDEIIQSWKQGLNKTGMKNVNKLDLSGFDMTDTKEILDGIKFEDFNLSNKDATQDIDINNGSEGLSKSLTNLFNE